MNKNKTDYLESIKSKSGNYKRINDTPLRYAGGKSLAVGLVIEHLPDNLSKVISPFIGGGSIEVAIAKNLGIEVIGNDIFDLLVNFWQIQIKEPERLAKFLSSIEPTKENYESIKQKLKKHWLNESIIENKIELAGLYYFNHNTSYGPGFLGWPSSIYMNDAKWQKMISKIQNFDVKNLLVYQSSFEDSIADAGKTFIYADPPYLLGETSKMFRGIYPQRNFPVHHNGFDHEKLRDLLHNHKGGFILSYNDTPEIRDWYKDFKIFEPQWQYTMGQGETRIGKNRAEQNQNHVKKSHELLIVKDK